MSFINAYCMPWVDEFLGIIGDAHFLAIDLTKGYWQIPLAPEEKTAFDMPSGLNHFKIMPFGLYRVAASFQHVMDKALASVCMTGQIFIMPDKLASSWHDPLTINWKKDVQKFLGLSKYYRHIMPHLVTLLTPLTNLIQGKGKGWEPVQWTAAAEKAFQCLKEVLCSYAILKTPTAQSSLCCVYRCIQNRIRGGTRPK